MANKKEVLNFFKNENFVASKKMGQNFLIDQNVIYKIKKIVEQINPKYILEIGPGLGAITQVIKPLAKEGYKAIEIDKRLYDYLVSNKILEEDEIICNDALHINWDGIFSSNNICLIGNLPYSISTPLIAKFIESVNIKNAILMLQLEMSERINAKVSSNDYTALSVFIQYFLNSKKCFTIEPSSFLPQPKIKSCISFFEKRTDLKEELDKKEFRNFLFKCFNQKRKTLVNNLKNYFPKKIVETFLKDLNLDLNVRPQDLDVSTFILLFKKILCQ